MYNQYNLISKPTRNVQCVKISVILIGRECLSMQSHRRLPAVEDGRAKEEEALFVIAKQCVAVNSDE